MEIESTNQTQTYFDNLKPQNQKTYLLYSLGDNTYGQLGYKTSNKTPKLISSLSSKKIISFSSGKAHNLALTNKGQIYCWGANVCGQLGIEIKKEGFPNPFILKSLNQIRIKTISCGNGHSLALTYNGDVYSWGADGCGQLGHDEKYSLKFDNEQEPYLDYPKLIENFKEIKIIDINCGSFHNSAIDNCGNVYMWGAGDKGQLGIRDYHNLKLDRGGFKYQPTPKMLNNLKNNNIYITKVVCGDFHTIFLSTLGEVYSCGEVIYGQLGLGYLNLHFLYEPKKIEGVLKNKNISFIASGSNHVVVIDNEGFCYGWGDNSLGQLGNVNKGDVYKFPKFLDFVKNDNLKDIKVVCRYNYTVFFSNNGFFIFLGDGNPFLIGKDKDKNLKWKRFFNGDIVDITFGDKFSIFSVEKEKELNEEIFDFLQDEKLCDFELVYNKENRLKCHKYILIWKSLYFRKKILEEGYNNKIEINSHINYKIFKTIIQYLYLDNFDFVNFCNDTNEIISYLSMAKLLKLNQLYKEIKSKLNEYTSKYVNILQGINSQTQYEKELKKRLLFTPEGKAILILNPETIEDINKNSIIINDKDDFENEIEEDNLIPLPENKIILPSEIKEKTAIYKLYPITKKILEDFEICDKNCKISEEQINESFILFNNSKICDIPIIIGNDTLYSNKLILSCCSLFFESMFNENMKENEIKQVSINEVSVNDIFVMFLYFYNQNIQYTFNVYLQILKCFDIFQVKDFLKIKLLRTIKEYISEDTVIKIFSIANSYNYEKLKKICLIYIKEKYNKIITSKSFENLQKDELIEIVRFCN